MGLSKNAFRIRGVRQQPRPEGGSGQAPGGEGLEEAKTTVAGPVHGTVRDLREVGGTVL